MSTRIIDPDVKSFFGSIWESTKAAAISTAEKATTGVFPIYIIVLCILIAGGVALWAILSKAPLFETASNIRDKIKKAVKAQEHYASVARNRKDLGTYLRQEEKKGLTASELAITNFYVSTVNATGFFFPATDGVFSPEAARLAVLAGARAFVFDIWPDLTPGAQFGPILQVVQEGSKWRRISLNSLQFHLVLKALIEEAFEVSGRPGSGDPVYFYLRFRGAPRSQTMSGTAAALRSVIEQYRLPNAYYNRRREGEIYTDPITRFLKKVIVCSNVTGHNTPLQDFINVGPRAGYKIEWPPNDAKAVTIAGKDAEIRKVQSYFTWVAPELNTPIAEDNQYDQQASWDLGIHFCAINFWADNDKTRAYMKPEKFGTFSFLLKPPPLRYKIVLLPKSEMPPDFGYGSGQTAGSMTKPPGMEIPEGGS